MMVGSVQFVHGVATGGVASVGKINQHEIMCWNLFLGSKMKKQTQPGRQCGSESKPNKRGNGRRDQPAERASNAPGSRTAGGRADTRRATCTCTSRPGQIQDGGMRENLSWIDGQTDLRACRAKSRLKMTCHRNQIDAYRAGGARRTAPANPASPGTANELKKMRCAAPSTTRQGFQWRCFGSFVQCGGLLSLPPSFVHVVGTI